MITKYDFYADKDQAEKIKDEVYALDSNFLRVNYRSRDGQLIIRYAPAYGETLELKVEALAKLKRYAELLRMRIFWDKV